VGDRGPRSGPATVATYRSEFFGQLGNRVYQTDPQTIFTSHLDSLARPGSFFSIPLIFSHTCIPTPFPCEKRTDTTNLLSSQFTMSVRALSRSVGGIASRIRPTYVGQRSASTSAQKDLKETLNEVIPLKREMLKKLKAEHGQKVLGEVRVENAIGGMRFAFLSRHPHLYNDFLMGCVNRGIKGMLWEGSVLDANEGIRFHGKTIKDCQKVLPKGTSGEEMLPEGMFWLLLTGQVPTVEQVRGLSRTLAENAGLPDFVEKMLDNMPTTLHPMTQCTPSRSPWLRIRAYNCDSRNRCLCSKPRLQVRQVIRERPIQSRLLGAHVRRLHRPPG